MREIRYSHRVLDGDREEAAPDRLWGKKLYRPAVAAATKSHSSPAPNHISIFLLVSLQSTMYTIQLPKSLVVAFVALSSSLWFTSLVLGSGMIYGEVGESKLSVFDFVTGQVAGLTEIN